MVKNSKTYIILSYEMNKLDFYLKKKKILINNENKLYMSNSENNITNK